MKLGVEFGVEGGSLSVSAWLMKQRCHFVVKRVSWGLRQESCTCPSPFYCACCAANGGTGYPSLLLCSARVS